MNNAGQGDHERRREGSTRMVEMGETSVSAAGCVVT